MWARNQDGRVAELIRHDPAGCYHPSISWVPVPEALRPWITNAWIVEDGAVAPASMAALLAQLLATLADRRWRAETGGLTLPQAGMEVRIATDRESQALINGAVALAQRDPARTFKFKTRTGWVTLSGAETIAIGETVGEHVQTAFDRECTLSETLTDAATDPATTPETLIAAYQAEIDTGWPGAAPV